MKKFILIAAVILLVKPLSYGTAFNLSFTGSGAAIIIDSIQVLNLRTGSMLMLLNNQNLSLITDESGLHPDYYAESKATIYPNPNQGEAILEFLSPLPGKAIISVSPMNGKTIHSEVYLCVSGLNRLKISLPQGIYFVSINGREINYSVKTISISENNQEASIKASISTSRIPASEGNEANMPYTQGDRLLLRAYAGEYSTFRTLIPVKSENVDFSFYACTDADGNHYPVVVLGNRVWMAENLRTITYRNKQKISKIEDTQTWKTADYSAVCNYANRTTITEESGLLYNWHSISNAGNITPENWYVPTDDDWFELDKYLNDNNLKYDLSSGLGLNPVGIRDDSGNFAKEGEIAAYWTSTALNEGSSLSRKLINEKDIISREIDLKSFGFSIRCVRPIYGAQALPVVLTSFPTEISSFSAQCNGMILHNGGNDIISSGICFNTTGNPTVEDSKLISSNNSEFTFRLNGLSFSTKYYLRAFAVNNTGISYGNEVIFNTPVLNVFDINRLPVINLKVTEAEWNKLLSYYDQNPHNEEKILSEFSFTYDGSTTTIQNTALRLRGNTSRRRPEGSSNSVHNRDNPDWHHASFSVDMNGYVSGQKFAGLKKVNLKWFKDDSMYAREIYCYDLFERFGVWTAPQSSYCKLYIRVAEDKNPAYFGVYELLESIDNDYLKSRKSQFGDDDGFLWKAFWGADFKSADASKMGIENVTLTSTYKPVYDLKNRPEELEAAKTQLLQFIRDLNQKTGTDFESWIESKTDVPLLLKTYAVNVLCGMWDDYWVNKNNFYFYFNSTGNFFFIPYDYDNTLGTSQIMSNSGTQDLLKWGNSSHPLVEKIIAIPKYKKLYVNYLHELCNANSGLFDINNSKARILGWHTLISDYIINDTEEDMVISDRPASWGNCSFYRLLENENNYFKIRSSILPAKIN